VEVKPNVDWNVKQDINWRRSKNSAAIILVFINEGNSRGKNWQCSFNVRI